MPSPSKEAGNENDVGRVIALMGHHGSDDQGDLSC